MTAKKKASSKKVASKKADEATFPSWLGKLPLALITIGALLGIIGVIVDTTHFTHAWLVSFMFYLSICCNFNKLIVL